MFGDAPEKMTYTEQANKRSHCRRLTCFMRLADYLIVNTMHVLAVNSVTTLLNYLSEQLANTPPEDDIRAFNRVVKGSSSSTAIAPAAALTLDDGDAQLPPLFVAEFLLEPNSILFRPDIDDFQDGISEVIRKFQEAVLGVMNLVPDPYFD